MKSACVVLQTQIISYKKGTFYSIKCTVVASLQITEHGLERFNMLTVNYLHQMKERDELLCVLFTGISYELCIKHHFKCHLYHHPGEMFVNFVHHSERIINLLNWRRSTLSSGLPLATRWLTEWLCPQRGCQLFWGRRSEIYQLGSELFWLLYQLNCSKASVNAAAHREACSATSTDLSLAH